MSGEIRREKGGETGTKGVTREIGWNNGRERG